MKSFFLLLFTVSLLVMTQVQTEVLGNKNSTSSTTKKLTDAAPALSSLGGGSVLLFLSNILIQLLHLS